LWVGSYECHEDLLFSFVHGLRIIWLNFQDDSSATAATTATEEEEDKAQGEEHRGRKAHSISKASRAALKAFAASHQSFSKPGILIRRRHITFGFLLDPPRLRLKKPRIEPSAQKAKQIE
jgi:hypothetical protein